MSPPTFPQDPPAYFSDQVLPSSDGVGGLEGRVGLGLSHVQRPHLLCQKGTLCHTWIALADVDSVFIPRRKALIPVAQYLVQTDTETHTERTRTRKLYYVGKHSSLWHSTWWKQTQRHTEIELELELENFITSASTHPCGTVPGGNRRRDTQRENSNSKTLFYKDCSLGSERVSNEVSRCFTPSQPVRLYQGDRETETRV